MAARDLRAVLPPIYLYTQRVRLTLGVADSIGAPVGQTVTGPDRAAAVARAAIGSDITECILVIFLDARQRVTGYCEVARGTFNAARVAARDVLIPALHAAAGHIVIAHNHPSGDPTPSLADRESASKLRKAADLVGITLTDNLIVTSSGHYSFREQEDWR